MARPLALQRKWIHVPVETKARELDAKALLCFVAAERGWGAILGPNHVLGPICRDKRSVLPLGVFIGAGISPGRQKTYRSIRERGSRLVSWCEEGLIYRAAEEYGRLKVEKASYELLDIFFAWGPSQASDLADLGCDGGRIIAAGNPRFDLLRPEMRDVFTARAAALRRRYGRFILVNTKFNKYNHYLGHDFYLKRLTGRGLLPTSAAAVEAAEYVEYQQAMMRAFVDAIRELSRRFPDVAIVVRPHPSEDHEPWREQAERLKNVEVVFTGNVVDWIMAAAATVHNNCTTGVEAYLSGRMTVAYRPLRDTRYDMYLPHAVSLEAADLESLCSLMRRSLEGQPPPTGSDHQVLRAIARRYISGLDGATSCERIMDAIETLDVPLELLSSDLRTDERAEIRSRSLPTISRSWQRDRIGRYRSYVQQKCGRITADEVRDFRTALSATTGRFQDLDVVDLGDDLLCICQSQPRSKPYRAGRWD